MKDRQLLERKLIDDQKNAVDRAIANVTRERDEKIRALEQEHTDLTQKLTSDLENQISSLMRQHEVERERTQEHRKALQLQIDRVVAERDEAMASCAQIRDQWQRCESYLKASQEEAEVIRGKGLRELQETEQRWRESSEQEIARLKSEHDAHTLALNERFEQGQRDAQAKINTAKKMIADLEYKNANRESRREDVVKINELIQSNKVKEEKLVQAYRELKQYRLDLFNKEETYNKVFSGGTRPLVEAASLSVAKAHQQQFMSTGTPAVSPLDPNGNRQPAFIFPARNQARHEKEVPMMNQSAPVGSIGSDRKKATDKQKESVRFGRRNTAENV